MQTLTDSEETGAVPLGLPFLLFFPNSLPLCVHAACVPFYYSLLC